MKYFYLSGSPCQISIAVATVVDPELRSVFTDGLLFLLENQYVLTETLNPTYKCIEGSGMGLLHASHVCNVLFSVMVEDKVLTKHAPSLLYYTGYHDDILSIHDSKDQMLEFWHDAKFHVADISRFASEQVCLANGTLIYLDLHVTFSVPTIGIEAAQDKPVVPCAPRVFTILVYIIVGPTLFVIVFTAYPIHPQ